MVRSGAAVHHLGTIFEDWPAGPSGCTRSARTESPPAACISTRSGGACATLGMRLLTTLLGWRRARPRGEVRSSGRGSAIARVAVPVRIAVRSRALSGAAGTRSCIARRRNSSRRPWGGRALRRRDLGAPARWREARRGRPFRRLQRSVRSLDRRHRQELRGLERLDAVRPPVAVLGAKRSAGSRRTASAPLQRAGRWNGGSASALCAPNCRSAARASPSLGADAFGRGRTTCSRSVTPRPRSTRSTA